MALRESALERIVIALNIGILSECQRQNETERRKFFKRKPFYGVEVIDEEKNGFCLVAVQLPYTLAQLENISEKKRLAAMCRASDILLSHGVNRAVYTVGIKQFFDSAAAQGLRIVQGGDLFYYFIPDIVRRLSEKCCMNKLSTRLGISDAGLGRISRRLMRELCYDARYIQLYTSDIEQGEALSALFSDEFGMPVTVSQSGNLNKCDILIDLDNRRIRVGRDLVVDGLELDFAVGGYEVDTMEIGNCLDVPLPVDKIRYCLSGKKRLTL